jgi:hypothetical protein
MKIITKPYYYIKYLIEKLIEYYYIQKLFKNSVYSKFKEGDKIKYVVKSMFCDLRHKDKIFTFHKFTNSKSFYNNKTYQYLQVKELLKSSPNHSLQTYNFELYEN